jgi:hypothetical protein
MQRVIPAYLRKDMQKRFGDRHATAKKTTTQVVNRTAENSVVRSVCADLESWRAGNAVKTTNRGRDARCPEKL